jgi:hypothetical protein
MDNLDHSIHPTILHRQSPVNGLFGAKLIQISAVPTNNH